MLFRSWDPLFYISLRMLRGFRITLLRLERLSFNLIQVINTKYEAHKNGVIHEHDQLADQTPNPEYWDELKGEKPKGETPK